MEYKKELHETFKSLECYIPYIKKANGIQYNAYLLYYLVN